ncbi:hypothetical protein D3C71_1599320 [compost metagenome]
MVTKARPAANALPLSRLEGKTKMIDCTTNSISAVSENPIRPMNELASDASSSPAAMVSRPPNSRVRQRLGEVARRGKVAAPMAAAIHGTAVSRPTWKGDSAP